MQKLHEMNADELIVAYPPTGADAWSEPQPLPESRPPVPAFNPTLLPEAIRPWVEDVSERIQCAPDYAAVGTMIALSSVIGRRVGICPKRHDDWLVVPNLWGGVVGRPGIMKTPALAEAMRPLRRLEAEAAEEHKAAMNDYELETMQRDARMKALQQKLTAASKQKDSDTSSAMNDIRELKEAAEGGPVCTRYETNDTTVEKLGELLSDNPNGLLVFRDELVGWLRNLDKQGHEGARSFFLEAWDGKSGFTYDRIGRGTVRMESACVSVLGGIQPGPLAQYVRDADKAGAGADGLLQRFQLLVYPDEPGTWRDVDRWPNSEARNNTFRHFWHLASMAPEEIHADMSGDIPFIRFSDEAQEIFTEWRTQLETVKLRADEPEIIESHLSKYRSLVPSLALICHLTDGGIGPVTDVAMLQAAAWADYLEAHARRIYSIVMNDNAALCELARRIQSGTVVDGFKPKNIYRNHWKHLDKDSTQRAIEGLEALGWLLVDEVQTGGRPTTRCFINPKVEVSR